MCNPVLNLKGTLCKTATTYNTLPHSTTLCKTLQDSARLCKTLQDSARLCKTLQHSCNILQHSVTHLMGPLNQCTDLQAVLHSRATKSFYNPDPPTAKDRWNPRIVWEIVTLLSVRGRQRARMRYQAFAIKSLQLIRIIAIPVWSPYERAVRGVGSHGG